MRHHWAFSLLITAGIIMLASALLIFASGGLSQLELFDEKPLLNKRRGEEPPEAKMRRALASMMIPAVINKENAQ